MNKLSHYERLRALRAQLHHFEQSPDFGDKDAVAVIRRHLLFRVREAERTLQLQLRVDSRHERVSGAIRESEAA